LEWEHDLWEVLHTVSKGESYLYGLRQRLSLDGPFLFSLIDHFRFHRITATSLSEWLQESVGFKLNEFEARLVLNRYDKNDDYNITLEEFLREVESPPIF